MTHDHTLEANCSTIIVGKAASATGHVILAHNEDDPNCFIQYHLVPRVKHEPGETVTFPDGTAVVPQVEETWAFFWSEFRAIGGEPFADSFVNEWGVAVCSNNCMGANHPADVTGGLGYGLRRLIAERATSARHGVEVLAGLMKEYGYRSARTYHIADKEEAWVVNVTTGHNFVARRVGDDELFFMPNWYTIHQIDFSDTQHKNFYWSEDLVGFALRNGYYTPAKAGDFSDFDFAKAYQNPAAELPVNVSRHEIGWSLLAPGVEVPQRTFSIKAPKTYAIEDLKPVLRAHGRTEPGQSPHMFNDYCGICFCISSESFIVEFAQEAELTCMWRSGTKCCTAPFMPWYLGINRLPNGYEWLGHRAAALSHFAVDEREVHYDSHYAYWAFHMLTNLREMDYAHGREMVEEQIAAMEATAALTKSAVDTAYRILAKDHPQAARELLTDYTAAQAQKAWDWAKRIAHDLVESRNSLNIAPLLPYLP